LGRNPDSNLNPSLSADLCAVPGPDSVCGAGPTGELDTADEEPIISFKNISISFGENPTLQDVNFYVERGKTLCILGRSGVGKSVSLRMLMGFLRPDAGSIRVTGQEITTLDEAGMQEIRKRVTMVFRMARSLTRFPSMRTWRFRCVSGARWMNRT